MSHSDLKVEKKKVNEMLVASVRFIGTVEEIPEHLGRLLNQVKTFSNGNPLVLFYPSAHLGDKDDLEVCVPVSESVDAEGITTRTLEGGEFITTVYRGLDADSAWNGLFAYINANGIHVRAPSREVYIVHNSDDPSANLIELQFPIIEKP